jgi:hypothetical protein
LHETEINNDEPYESYKNELNESKTLTDFWIEIKWKIEHNKI